MSGATIDSADAAMDGPEARSQYDVDGTGVKVGIINYSFNTGGGAAANETAGLLPDVDVLSDGTGPSNDEGQAMAEMVHATAPGAQIVFASAGNSDASFAAAIQTLQAAGCKVIVDGYRFADEPFFGDSGVISSALNTAVAAGITYVTAAGNLGTQYYQHAIVMKQATLPGGVGTANAYDFNLGVGTPNPLQSLTIPANSTVSLDLQWNQPFLVPGATTGGSAFTLNMYLFNAAGQVVAQATQNATGGNPVQTIFNFDNTTSSTAFTLAITAGNGVPTGTLKYIVLDNSGVVINDPNAGQGSGTLIGHQMDPNAITVGDVAYQNTPEAGGTLKLQTDQSVGPGSSGGGISVVAPVGSTSSLAGLSPYYGTNAAAANVAAVSALMLQANPKLTPADVDALLKDSALTVPLASTAAQGSGLVQANRAVAFASTGIITAAAGGTTTYYGTSQPETFVVGTGANSINLGSGASLVVSAGADTIASGTGNDTVNVLGLGALVFGGSGTTVLDPGLGANTLFGGAGAETVFGGTGSGIYFGGTNGENVLEGGAQQSILVAGGTGDELFAGSGGDNVLFGAATGNVVLSSGASTTGNIYVALSSNDVIGTGLGANTTFLGSGNDIVYTGGADTVIGNTGNATVSVLAGNLFMEAGSGKTLIMPGAGVNTVFGTTGSETVLGGSGGGIYRAGYGGNNQLVAGADQTTLVGANTGDQLFAAGGGGDALIAGLGNETLGSGAATGANSFTAGVGTDLIALGIFNDTIVAGAGNASITSNGGAKTYMFVDGSAGGTDTIANFQRGADKIVLSGYGAGAGTTAVLGQKLVGGSTVVTLADSTKIVFANINSVSASSFVSS